MRLTEGSQPELRVAVWLEGTRTSSVDKLVVHDAITGMHETRILDNHPGLWSQHGLTTNGPWSTRACTRHPTKKKHTIDVGQYHNRSQYILRLQLACLGEWRACFCAWSFVILARTTQVRAPSTERDSDSGRVRRVGAEQPTALLGQRQSERGL
jgi:hypothetical protein